jgi:hypothetical protein
MTTKLQIMAAEAISDFIEEQIAHLNQPQKEKPFHNTS